MLPVLFSGFLSFLLTQLVDFSSLHILFTLAITSLQGELGLDVWSGLFTPEVSLTGAECC